MSRESIEIKIGSLEDVENFHKNYIYCWSFYEYGVEEVHLYCPKDIWEKYFSKLSSSPSKISRYEDCMIEIRESHPYSDYFGLKYHSSDITELEKRIIAIEFLKNNIYCWSYYKDHAVYHVFILRDNWKEIEPTYKLTRHVPIEISTTIISHDNPAFNYFADNLFFYQI